MNLEYPNTKFLDIKISTSPSSLINNRFKGYECATLQYSGTWLYPTVTIKMLKNTWKWADGWPVEYTNWYNTEFENGTCAFIKSQ